ncbi:MAG: aldo/keto reductase [Blautia obeum]
MKKITIKNTDLELSPMGMGCVNAGIKWDGEDAFRIFDAFLDMGGTVYDTARVYADWIPPEIGRSERVLGQWLHKSGKRHDIILVSKGGHPDMTPAVPNMHASRISAENMRHDLELSLRALGTDYIDVYFYHRDNEAIPASELIEVMEEFRKEGKIRYYACSNWSTARMRVADAYAAPKGYCGFVANAALFIACFMKPLEDDNEDHGSRMQQYHTENRIGLSIMSCVDFSTNYMPAVLMLSEI